MGVAVVALHWAGLQLAARVLAPEPLGRPRLGDVPAIRLVAPGAPAAPRADPPERRAAVGPLEAPASRPRPTAGPRSADPAAGTAASTPVDPASHTDGYRFYSAKEVDVTAEPVARWNLDPAELDALAVSRIVFTLLVGRDGSVLHCSVEEPARLSPGQKRSLATRLAATEMRPARRAGVAVPSRRQVEIYVVGGT